MSTEPPGSGMPKARTAIYLIGSAGAILLLSGVLLPAVEPSLGSTRPYIVYFPPEGVLLLLLVTASVVVMKRRGPRRLLAVGALALSTVAFSYGREEHRKSVRISEAWERASEEDQKSHPEWPLWWDDPDAESSSLRRKHIEGYVDLVRMMLEGDRYKEAWGVLIAGSVLLMTAGLLTYGSVERWVFQTFALYERPGKRCPSCAGLNSAEAVKCKHCGEVID